MFVAVPHSDTVPRLFPSKYNPERQQEADLPEPQAASSRAIDNPYDRTRSLPNLRQTATAAEQLARNHKSWRWGAPGNTGVEGTWKREADHRKPTKLRSGGRREGQVGGWSRAEADVEGQVGGRSRAEADVEGRMAAASGGREGRREEGGRASSTSVSLSWTWRGRGLRDAGWDLGPGGRALCASVRRGAVDSAGLGWGSRRGSVTTPAAPDSYILPSRPWPYFVAKKNIGPI